LVSGVGSVPHPSKIRWVDFVDLFKGFTFILPKVDLTAKPTDNPIQANLIIMATNWGFTGTLDNFCAAAK
jgi:hypothetical protein